MVTFIVLHMVMNINFQLPAHCAFLLLSSLSIHYNDCYYLVLRIVAFKLGSSIPI